MSPDPDSEPRWHPLKKVLFRFFCVYFVLYAFPFPYVDPLPGAALLGKVWDPVVLWVGQHVLGIGYKIGTEVTGSGDRTYDYVQFFTMVTLSLAGCLVWSLVDRKREHYRGLARWLVVGCRYFLAYVMLSYGFHKVIKMQLSFPGRFLDHGDAAGAGGFSAGEPWVQLGQRGSLQPLKVHRPQLAAVKM